MNQILKKLLMFFFLIISITSNTITLATVIEDEDFLDPKEAFVPSLDIKDNTLTITWKIEPDYFLYLHGFKILAEYRETTTQLAFTINPGIKKFDDYLNKEVATYHATAMLKTNIANFVGKNFTMTLSAQGCADAGLCFPPTHYPFVINSSSLISANSNIPSSVIKNISFDSTQPLGVSFLGILFTIVGAISGGLILNLMPCVFPVLSLKALSFTSGHSSAKNRHQHGWMYTAGVISSFLLAASIILIAKATGESLGWGFQLQHPIFVTLMVYLFFIMGLSLSGFIELGGAFMGAGQKLTTGDNLKSSFFTGVLAALVASPCTAPFMATALGVALTQPIPISLIIFASLGFGMALPFLLLSYSPRLARLMPRPGAWMITFKQALAFPLYLTAIWLLWVLSHQAGQNIVVVTLIGMLAISFSIWLFSLPSKSSRTNIVITIMAILFLIPAVFIAFNATSKQEYGQSDEHEKFSLERLNFYRSEGTPVLVDLTADWCLTCKVNETIALTDKVKNILKESGGALLVGDWTNKNPDLEALLKHHQRSGIPLYLMYPKNGGEPEMLPQLLTERIVLDAIERSLL